MKYKLNNWEWGVRSEVVVTDRIPRPYVRTLQAVPCRAGEGGGGSSLQSSDNHQEECTSTVHSTQYTVVHQCSQCRTVTSSWLLKLRVMCEAPRWQAAWPGYQESSAELSRVSPAVRSQVFQHNSEILSQTSDRPGHHGAAPLCHFISRHHSR